MVSDRSGELGNVDCRGSKGGFCAPVVRLGETRIMKKIVLAILVCFFTIGSGSISAQTTPPGNPPVTATSTTLYPSGCLTAEEAELARLINGMRQEKGLPAIKVIPELYSVARWHVIDLATNGPHKGAKDAKGKPCDLHSWSAKGAEMVAAVSPAGAANATVADPTLQAYYSWKPWNAVCYTADHSHAEEMWRKPREITEYAGVGYEIIYWTSAPLSPTMAVKKWEGSPTERDMLLESGDWRGSGWISMGVGIHGNFASVWLGSQPARENRVVSLCPAGK